MKKFKKMKNVEKKYKIEKIKKIEKKYLFKYFFIISYKFGAYIKSLQRSTEISLRRAFLYLFI